MNKTMTVLMISLILIFQSVCAKQLSSLNKKNIQLINKKQVQSVLSVMDKSIQSREFKDIADISLSQKGEIAYIPNIGPNSFVHIINAEGALENTITDLGKQHYMVDWLNNDEILIGVSLDLENEDDAFNTFIFNNKTGKKSLISKGNYGGYGSIENNSILIINSIHEGDNGIYEINLANGNKKLIYDIGNMFSHSPRYGKNYICYIDYLGKEKIVLIDKANKSKKMINVTASASQQIKSYYCGKNKIIFLLMDKKNNTQKYSLWQIDYDGGNREQIEFDGVNMSSIDNFKWYEDMQKVVLLQGTTATIIDLAE